ncbi:MAG: UDP-N-acetylmuramoyl-tripeptide--D-alanyl-D-alanine ligase, partial [Pseudomonadales bacterium]|nr:UDP-N-acetylmuramoyl-tripeptide--D-alanyl-D-alanine ligase [Pseudomonadales bacterium]
FSANTTRPNIALLICASAAHVEGFGSLEGIVEAKGEILDSLSADGVAVLNADDTYVQRWIDRSSHCSTVLFSGHNNEAAHYKARNVTTRKGSGVSFELVTPQGEIDISLGLLGEHNSINAAAAAAVAMEAGASLAEVKSGLAAVQPVKGRLVQRNGRQGSTLIDDTYNASPSSFKAAIDVLAQFDGRKILIAGDMKELGLEAEASHALVGEHARLCGIDEVWVTGEFANVVAQSFGATAQIFHTQDALIEHGLEQVKEDGVYLIKGSRGARMDKVVDSLRQEGAA